MLSSFSTVRFHHDTVEKGSGWCKITTPWRRALGGARSQHPGEGLWVVHDRHTQEKGSGWCKITTPRRSYVLPRTENGFSLPKCAARLETQSEQAAPELNLKQRSKPLLDLTHTLLHHLPVSALRVSPCTELTHSRYSRRWLSISCACELAHRASNVCTEDKQAIFTVTIIQAEVAFKI